MTPDDCIIWPARALPRVVLVGLHPLAVRAFDHVYKSPTHAVHLHDYEGVIRIGEREFPLGNAVFTWSPAGVESSYDLPRAGTHWVIHFQPAADSAQPALRLPLCKDLGRHRAEITGRFGRIARLQAMETRRLAGRDGTPAGEGALASAASVLLLEMLTWISLLDVVEGPRTDGGPGAAVDAVKEFVDRNLHRPLTIPDLADRVGLSQNYLARVFKEQTGMTIPRYLMTQRVALARLLLRTTDLSIKQIGVRVGCPDPQHLNKLFRDIEGVSPSAYRFGGR